MMPTERAGDESVVYGRSAETTGREVKLVRALPSPAGIRAWLMTGGQSLSFDLENARRLILALEAFVADTEATGSAVSPVEVPEAVPEKVHSLMERTVAVADEWRQYASTLPEGPVRARALQLAATVYVEHAMVGLDQIGRNESA